MKIKILIIWLFLASADFANLRLPASANPKDSTVPAAAAYLGQTPPGDAAVIFAPDFISTPTRFAGNSTFSPDGTEFYFSVTNKQWDNFAIMYTKFENGAWTSPAKADFLENKFTLEPFYTPTGNRIFFNGGDAGNTDIWYCEKNGDAWGRPVKLPEPVGSARFEWFPSLTKQNTLFFTRDGKIYSSACQNSAYNTIVKLGMPVNTSKYQSGDPYIAPDGDYLIFMSTDWPGGYGQGDLHITYKKNNGGWTNPKNLGPAINTVEFECGPSVTPNGKYFMFTRRKQWQTDMPSKIYWIKADFIERLRHTNFAPYANTPIPDQSRVMGQLFTFSFPADAFVDDDGNDTLTYSAALDNGAALPSWLQFNSSRRSFSGTPTGIGAVKIKITAIDLATAAAETTFTLSVADGGAEAKKPAVSPVLKGVYFGMIPPGKTPVPFAPEILSKMSIWVEATDFSPDGTHFLMAVGDETYSSARLLYSHCVDNVWTPFIDAPFCADFVFAHEPHFAGNGVTLAFTGRKATGTQDIWGIRYSDEGWGTPAPLPAPINSDGKEWRGSTAADGIMYFGSDRATAGLNQIYKAYRGGDQNWVAEKLPPPINTNSYEGDPCVAPDGRFLVFYSACDGKSSDLYVSFSDGKGNWGTPVNLGAEFNTAADEYGAHLSSDGKYMFFTRHTAQGNSIYWVAASAIDRFKI